jgi:hypothetical protein
MLEQLKARIIELTAQKQQAQAILNQALADIQTINGAIMENQRWAKLLESGETEKPKEVKQNEG